MANVKAGNTYYIDSTGALSIAANEKIAMVLLTATASNGRIVISDNSSSPQTKMDLREATSGATARFNFVGAEVHALQGLNITTLSNAVATIVLKKAGG